MDQKTLEHIVKHEGFEKAAEISTDDLVFVPEYRKFCEENACGNYNKNYACPPYSGTPKEMKQRVLAYRRCIVFQSKTPVKDAFDDAEMKKLKRKHTQMTLQAMKELKTDGMDMDGFPIMCGPCNFCEECMMPSGKPCVKESMRFSCLSAYCIDVGKLAESCNMEIQWSGNEVYYFSIYVFDKKDKSGEIR